jgi:hypothetical protein
MVVAIDAQANHQFLPSKLDQEPSMSSMSILNKTTFIAQFVIRKGEQIIARLPGIAPGASMTVPTDDSYQVTAMAVIDGNTYTSAPMDVSGPTGFLAQVIQVRAQGTYEFNVVETPSHAPNQLQFQKTCLSPVTYTIAKNGKALQTVVVRDSFETVTLDISDTFYIYAVVNGVTTDTVVTTNPSATVTAVQDTSDLEYGYYSLEIN